jgi:subtilisin family serine protease
LEDVLESDVMEHFMADFSGRELHGQDLDVLASGFLVPSPASQYGGVEYGWFSGTSAAAPHVAGVAALMLQKNPTLTPAQIEDIMETTASPLPPGCRDVRVGSIGPGRSPTLSNFRTALLFDATVCWEANATGHGLIQADAALAATPLP